MTEVVTKQVVSLFIIMLVGFLASGIGFFDKRTSDGISKLIVYVTNPLLIFTAFLNSGKGNMGAMFTVIGCSILIHVAVTVFVMFLFKGRSPKEATALRFSVIFSNCGYMGYPLLTAVFPKNGMFYGACYVLFFTLYLWTVGVFMLSSGKRGTKAACLRKAVLNPGVIAAVLGLVLSLIGIKLPDALSTALSSTANLTFPLSMLVLGCMLRYAPLKEIFTNVYAYIASAIRLLLVPLAVLLVCGIFNVSSGTSYICVILSATPVAAKAPIMAGIYGADKNTTLATVAISTVFSVLTIPLVIALTKGVVGA
ncbi:MAG: AEC family transporter [Clostridia bacterium]|nr:AEC family transporter [Clostridia bacterium]